MVSSPGLASFACSAAVCTVVRRMLFAWKNAHRFDASTFLAIDSVCAPLPSVSDNARHNAITAIRSAIFLFSTEACSACSACSMLSCALMIILSHKPATTMDEQEGRRKGPIKTDVGGLPEISRFSCAGVRASVHFEKPLAVD